MSSLNKQLAKDIVAKLRKNWPHGWEKEAHEVPAAIEPLIEAHWARMVVGGEDRPVQIELNPDGTWKPLN